MTEVLVEGALVAGAAKKVNISGLFAAIDGKRAVDFGAYLSVNASFIFGNMPAVEGVDNIIAFVGQFFDSIADISHRIEHTWYVGDSCICKGEATYRRHDGSTLTVPFANVLDCQSDGIVRYQIYSDNSALYQ